MNRFIGGWGLVFSLCLSSTLLAAQTPAPKPADVPASASPAPAMQAPDIRVSVERVNVPFVVVDSKGRYVTDLTKDDFTLKEDGKPVPIENFVSVTSIPLRVGLLLDTSNSVRLQFKSEQEAAIDFVHTLLPDRTRHEIFLMTFDTTKDIVKDFTGDPNDLSEAIRKLKVGGGTSLFDAIYQACHDRLAKQNDPDGVRRVLVLITDGEDDASKYSIEQTIEMARRAQVSIYAISTVGYGSASPGDRILERLADETGGSVVFPWKKPPSADYGTGYLSHTQIGDTNAVYEVGLGKYAGEAAESLATALAQINKELTMQYSIFYRPPNPNQDGRFRAIQVEVKDHAYHVRARKGYYAAPPL